jgi:hypothetical protein
MSSPDDGHLSALEAVYKSVRDYAEPEVSRKVRFHGRFRAFLAMLPPLSAAATR